MTSIERAVVWTENSWILDLTATFMLCFAKKKKKVFPNIFKISFFLVK